MTFKDTISGFRVQLEDIAFSRKVPVKKYSNLEILYKLSLVQSEISNLWRMYEVKTTFGLIGVQEYTTNTLMPNCLNIVKLVIGVNNLNKISMDDMNEVTAEAGEPTAYSTYADKIRFNTLYTGTVTAYYYKRIDPYDSGDTDFDETKTGWQTIGWLIGEEYHWLLIEGALAKMFPDMWQSYNKKLSDILNARSVMPVSTEGFLGI